MARTRRVFILGNPEKPEVVRVLDDLRSFASSQALVVGSSLGTDGLAAVKARAERILVLGGDGTLIGVARSLGSDAIPLIGVNVGKLGFLAEFSIDELKSGFDRALHDDTLVSRRTVLEATVHRNGGVCNTSRAINDCVIQAGPPFRMIRLGITINGQDLTEVAGDGLIVCTPGGSTAHNLSAGGPILAPDVDAIILTSMNPHSLTHKPLVIGREAVIDIHALAVNPGTTAIFDGQVSCPLQVDDRVTIQRFETDWRTVRNPIHPDWHKLVSKLHWGRPPNFRQPE